MRSNINYTKNKAFIKDLELQIDYLVGYTPAGNHWKQEYHIRKELIDSTLAHESTPKEVIEKIFRIQDTIYRLQNKIKHNQGYITYSQIEYTITHQIKVNNNRTGESYFI